MSAVLETGNSTVTLVSNLRIYPALVDGYLPFAHFFPSSVCSTYYIVQSNISICLSTLVSSYSKRLWARVSYSATGKITKGRSIELTVTKRRKNFPFRPKFLELPSYFNHHTTMKDSKIYRVSKLKRSENYESWKKNIINVLKVKDLWMIILRKLKKSTSLTFNVSTADKKKYITDVQHWEDRNDRVSDIIDFSCEKRLRIHIFKADNIIKMWFILKT